MAISLTIADIGQTQAAAAAIASVIDEGDVLLLEGELGAGKTALVAAVAVGLGATEPVRSPTYTIGHLYDCGAGRQLAHLDLYRTPVIDVAQWGDIEAYFEQATWACVEWPGAIADWLQGRRLWHVAIDHAGGERRLLRVSAPTPDRAHQLLERVA